MGRRKDIKAVIYAKTTAGKPARAQVSDLRRLCRERGWSVVEVYQDPPGRPQKLASGKARLALIDDLLHRKYEAVCVWRLGMLGNCIDDLLWLLEEAHVRRGVHVVAQADGVDTAVDGTATRVFAALARVGRTGDEG